MTIRAFVAAALAVAAPALAAAAPLQPTGKWIVHFDEAQCVAQRDYGPKGKPLYLLLKQPALGGVVQIDVVEKGYAATSQIDGRIQFDDANPQNASVLSFSPEDTGTRVRLLNLPLDQFAAARTAHSIHIEAGALDRSFALADMPALIEVMDKCVADLRRVWNVSETKGGEAQVRQDAEGNLRKLFSSDDYPFVSLVNNDSGTVKIALLVNEQGRVADCSVIETSGVAMLDAQSCAVVTARARFTPAIGKDGKPTKDSFIETINWKLG
jgi:TonB family protein